METLNNNTTESEKEKFDKNILKDPELLRHLYHVKLLSFSKIANKIGCNPSTVYKVFKKYGIPTRSYSQSTRLFMEKRQPFDRSILDDAERLRHLYHIEKKSAPEIAEMIGCCTSTVYDYLRKHEIAIRSRKESNRLTTEKRFPFDRSILEDAERLQQLYHGETKSAKEIAILIGCDEATVFSYMKKHVLKELQPLPSLVCFLIFF